MLPIMRFHGFDSWVDHSAGYLQSQQIMSTESAGRRSKAGRKPTAACNSHREAERRRRQRINAHLATLRSLLPNAANTKSDKASLLGKVVQHVRELRKRVDDVARRHDEAGSVRCFENEPGELDEATVNYCDREVMMKSTVCCEGLPGLNWDLTQAIRSVRAKPVRAEMMTVGGRTKIVVVIQRTLGGAGEEEIGAQERALKAVVDNRALVGSEMGQIIFGLEVID